eukprot:TRINITY_DN71263_c0_g1_i1.p1 TRINITY_DN71263_c0_g1~~TRINITY_DN71263_c0_g1_i1.p1  ORF type:complete len:174 (-),score=32.69 TRINITY_DN71263_c0_g1_i1:38-559(-)
MENPVPTGGMRIPEGMEGPPPEGWEYTPPKSSSEYGDEYVLTEKKRDLLGELKKTLSASTMPLFNVWKQKVLLAKCPEDDADKRANLEQVLKREQAAHAENVAKVAALRKQLEGMGWEFGAETELMDLLPTKEELSKEEHQRWTVFVNQHTGRIFREQSKLLAKMKEIKKTRA